MRFVLAIISLPLVMMHCSAPKEQNAANEKPAFSKEITTFNYTAAEPVDGKNKGVIVLGSHGFDAFLINVDSLDRWELLEAKYGNSNVLNDSINFDSLVTGIQDYADFFFSKGLSRKDVFLVFSSSAVQNEVTKDIVVRVVETRNIRIKVVSEKEEARYAYKAVIPKEFEKESFVVDIGSGNTKISWLQNGDIMSVASYGSQFMRDSVKLESVTMAMEEAVKLVPMEQRVNCFLIGGAAYELAEATEKYNERYTVLNKLETYKPATARAKGGLEILKAMQAAGDVSNYIFDWESNFGIGYVLTVN